MAVKKMQYKEPKDYFTPAMLRAADKWENEHQAKKESSEKKPSGKKK